MSIDANLAKMTVNPKSSGSEVLAYMDKRLETMEKSLMKFQGDVISKLGSIELKLREHEEKLNTIVDNTKKTNPCAFCEENPDGHKTWRCGKYTNATTRMRRAMELGLCLRCLVQIEDNGNHQCDLRCAACGDEDHHTLLCSNKSGMGPNRKRPRN